MKWGEVMKKVEQLDGKYEILKEIGRGGMSIVYLAMDLHIHKTWAIKVIAKACENTTSLILLQTWQQEADLLKELNHPSLPRIVDIVETSDEVCIVMDYIDGRSLDDIIKTYGAQSFDFVLSLGNQLCDILEYLHAQQPPIIYRDLKPANIMIRTRGDICLIDFGIARRYRKENRQDTDVLGTQGYAAPEQFSRHEQSDVRSDIYALGATLFHVASGQHPLAFGSQRPKANVVNTQISNGLAMVLEHCMAPLPKQRYQNIEEVRYALAHAEEYEQAYRRKQQWHLGILALCLLGIAFLLAGGKWALSQAQHLHTLTYEGFLAQARQEQQYAKQKEALHQAIQLLPERKTAYVELLQLYKEDGVFSFAEEADLKAYLQPYLRKSASFYGELCFQIGKLYWYYYETQEKKQPALTRMKAAYFWFHEVNDKTYAEGQTDVEMAKTYARIGHFHQTITLRMEEVEDRGMYKSCFQDMQKMYHDHKVHKQAEIVELESDRMIVSLLVSYAHGFSMDGIKEERMLKQLRAIQDDVAQLSAASDKTKQIKKEIMTMCQTGKRLIHYACVKRKEEAE